MKKKNRKIFSWLLRFIQIQLLMTLVSMPILVIWGLPISLLSPIGNLIFNPFLIVFLFLSSLIFFLELLHLPNAWFIYLLELTTQCWSYIVQQASSKVLVGFAQPAWWFFPILLLLIVAILHHKKYGSQWRSSLLFLGLLCASGIYLKLCSISKPCIEHIEHQRGNVTLIKAGKSTVLIDPGVIGSTRSASSWAEYTLVPALLKKHGITTIDHLIILQPGIMLFQALKTLTGLVTIKQCYCTCWEGNDRMLNRAYILFKKELEKQGGTFVRIKQYKKKINLVKQIAITIDPLILKQLISYREVTFPACMVACSINNQDIEIISKKSKKI